MTRALLEYFLLPERTLLFVRLPQATEPDLVTLNVGRDEVRRRVVQMREQILDLDESPRAGRWLADNLLRPALLKLPADVSQLVIVPHGELHHVPFGCLPDASGHVADRFTISQIPSLQALHYVRERPRLSKRACLAVGAAPHDPLFMRRSFEGEAAEVGRRLGGTVVVGPEATRARLLELLPDSAVVHLATHGRFVPEAALESGLEVSPDATSRADVLTARDLLKQTLSATLVVLSACQTGLSAVYPGDELEGLTRALLHAGAASVLVSLWPVDTVATRVWMRAFYDAWTPGVGKADAARQAARVVRGLTLDRVLADAHDEMKTADASDKLRLHAELGDLHWRLGRAGEAAAHYRAALNLAHDLNEPADAVLLSESLADVCEDERDALRQARESPRYQRARGAAVRRVRSSVGALAGGATQRGDGTTIRPWAAPFFWSAFALVGDWR